MYSWYRHKKRVTFSIVYQALFACFIIIGQQRNIQLLSVFQYELSLYNILWSMNLDICWAGGGGGARVVVSTAAFHARVWGSFPSLGGLKGTKMFLPHPLVKFSIVGSLCDRDVACSASDPQGLNFEFCVWRAVLSHHPQEVLLGKFSLYVHKSAFGYLLKGDKSVLMNYLRSDSETVPKPNVLLVDHMYGEREGTVADIADSCKACLTSGEKYLGATIFIISIGLWRIKCQRSWASEKSWGQFLYRT